MKYREVLELYKKNELNEIQKQQVEDDIARQEAISEYLFDKEEADEFVVDDFRRTEYTEIKKGQKKNAEDFTKIINRKIRNAFIKMGAVIVGITMAAVLFVVFALPKLINQHYYNPGKVIGENTNQMSLDMRVYTEATMPLKIRSNVDVNEKGYGNYGIYIPQTLSYTGTFQSVSGEINKGELTFYNSDILKKPSSNMFAWFQIYGNSEKPLSYWIDEAGQMNTSIAAALDDPMEKLYSLKENTLYEAYVTLDKMLPYEEFMKFQESTGVAAGWCAILTESPADNGGKIMVENLGMECALTMSSVLKFDEEAYPELQVWRTELGVVDEVEDNTSLAEENIWKEEPMKQHFISMMKYLSDQKDFLAMMGEKDTKRFERAAEYVEENGLMVYGYVVLEEKEELIQLAEENQDAIYQIYAIEAQ